jgi:hypothetical protein
MAVMANSDPKRDALEYALTNWARDRRQVDESRDPLVQAAVAAGISKHRVHVLTGIARTTINKITKAS